MQSSHELRLFRSKDCPLDMFDEYSNIQPLGTGSYGQVYVATKNSTKQPVVLKKIAKGPNNHRVHTEIEAGILLKNKTGIASFHESFETERSFWLVFDRIKGSDMFSMLEDRDFHPLPEKTVKIILRQLVRSLLIAHEAGVAHKDIKLENIVYDEQTGKAHLIDFGLANVRNSNNNNTNTNATDDNNNTQTTSTTKRDQNDDDDKTCTDFSGSKEYSPPEILSRVAYSPFKADVWSLGVTAFALIYGVFPFGMTLEDYVHVQLTGQHPPPNFPDNVNISPDAKDLLEKMLALNPNERLSLREVQNHPFLRRTLRLKRKFFTLWGSSDKEN